MTTIAIIGRPNVGKSTLFNRLAGRKHAIVHDRPGVTRDRLRVTATLGKRQFDLIDTPGLEEADKGSLQELMMRQSLAAIEEADGILFIIDAKEGITPRDQHFAKLIRNSGKPVVLVANKSDTKQARAGETEAFRLGFGTPVAVSAEHGLGMDALEEALEPLINVSSSPSPSLTLPLKGEGKRKRAARSDSTLSLQGEGGGEGETMAIPKPIRVAIVGRPNAGKSTLINRLLGEERLLTGPYAGMTRDAVTVPFRFQNTDFLMVDTAGMRRKANIVEQLEQLSVKDTTTALGFAEVVILMLDATTALEKQDNIIASLIAREGRACVVAVNKWDLVEDKKMYLKVLKERLPEVMSELSGVAVISISAERGEGLEPLMKAVIRAYMLWNRKLPTSALNRWLETALQTHTPPMVRGRRFKIRYITQSKARPPTFLLFVNKKEDAPESYLRYLINDLRESFKLPGVPIRLQLRAGKNPYI